MAKTSCLQLSIRPALLASPAACPPKSRSARFLICKQFPPHLPAVRPAAVAVNLAAMKIVPLLQVHYEQVNAIYREGIATGHATFQTEGKIWDEWDSGHLSSCRLVAVEGDIVLGWGGLSLVSSRCVYAGVAEVSEYIAEVARGKGIGKALLQQIITDSEAAGIWTLQAGIFPENKASLALHHSCGFRTVGYRERIGRMKNGAWRDTILLERRSAITGI